MQNYISIMIAEEYFSIQELQKASTLYTRCLPSYERECWTQLVDDIKARLSMIDCSRVVSEN